MNTRVELSPQATAVLRGLIEHSAAGARSPQAEHLVHLLEVAGIDPAAIWTATGDYLPVRLEASPLGDAHVSLVVDAVASDLSYVSSWKPSLPPVPDQPGSTVLARSGLVTSPAAAAAPQPLLEACTRYAERLASAASDVAALPFEIRVQAWPVGKAADSRPTQIERYLAAGPDAGAFALRMEAQRKQQIGAAAAMVPARFVPKRWADGGLSGLPTGGEDSSEDAMTADAREQVAA